MRPIGEEKSREVTDRIETSVSSNDDDRPWQSYNTVYTNAKAGMEGVDKEKVQRIVYEMSKGSKYFANEEKKEADVKQKIDSMGAQLEKLSLMDKSHYQKTADKRIVELEATRDLSRLWLHVDMDAFYASVETLCNDSLKGKPMAVGSMSMISTANYEARRFGVRAAMPGFIARKLCPELIFVPTDFKKYNYYSDLTRKVFQKYNSNFLAASLDEAYIDITKYCDDNKMTGEELAEELRESVHKETGLTCSAGVAPNRLLAKVCSDINKPNGQFVLPNERMAVMTFISSLPIRKIGGIGKVTESLLKGVFEIKTCEEMLQKSGLICALFSPSSAEFFLSVGLGLGRTDMPQFSPRKSISTERTFSSTEDETLLYEKLVDLAENLSNDMKKAGLCGRTLTLKLKTSCFEVRTRAVTLPNHICSAEDILRHATKLLKAELPISLRLMGLRMSHFSEGTNGAALDPKQKTLSNFMATQDDDSGRVLGEQARIEASISDDILASDKGTSLSTHEGHENINLSGHTSLRGDNHDNTEAGSRLDLQITETQPNVNEAASSIAETASHSEESMCWLNGYQCSICGAELPPSFVEERQEHLDFHLAEKLQEEDSINIGRFVKRDMKSIQKDRHDQINQSRPRKKQKRSPSKGKHIPIDAFFAKAS